MKNHKIVIKKLFLIRQSGITLDNEIKVHFFLYKFIAESLNVIYGQFHVMFAQTFNQHVINHIKDF
jgi:hypothetical protein